MTKEKVLPLTQKERAKAEEIEKRYRYLKAEPEYDHIFGIADRKHRISGLRKGDPDASKANLIHYIIEHEFGVEGLRLWGRWMEENKKFKKQQRREDRKARKKGIDNYPESVEETFSERNLEKMLHL